MASYCRARSGAPACAYAFLSVAVSHSGTSDSETAAHGGYYLSLFQCTHVDCT